MLSYELMDKMRADATVDFSVADPTTVNCTDTNPNAYADTTAEMAVCVWLQDLQNRLPFGTGTIVVNPSDANMFDVTVQWSDRQIDNAADCAAATRTFDVVNNICLISQIWTVYPQ